MPLLYVSCNESCLVEYGSNMLPCSRLRPAVFSMHTGSVNSLNVYFADPKSGDTLLCRRSAAVTNQAAGTFCSGCKAWLLGEGCYVIVKRPKSPSVTVPCYGLLSGCDYSANGKPARVELYNEGVLKLYISPRGTYQQQCYILGKGSGGRLERISLDKASLLGIIISDADDEHRERLLILNDRLETVLDATGDSAIITEGRAEIIDELGTLCGHQRRKSYELTEKSSAQSSVDIGFFTTQKQRPNSEPETALSFAEAIKLRLYEEAREYLSPELAASLSDDAMAEFFGKFEDAFVIPPQYACGKVCLGICGSENNSGGDEQLILFPFKSQPAKRADLYSISFEDGRIADIDSEEQYK